MESRFDGALSAIKIMRKFFFAEVHEVSEVDDDSVLFLHLVERSDERGGTFPVDQCIVDGVIDLCDRCLNTPFAPALNLAQRCQRLVDRDLENPWSEGLFVFEPAHGFVASHERLLRYVPRLIRVVQDQEGSTKYLLLIYLDQALECLGIAGSCPRDQGLLFFGIPHAHLLLLMNCTVGSRTVELDRYNSGSPIVFWMRYLDR